MKRSAQGIGTVHKNCVRKTDRKEQYCAVFRIRIDPDSSGPANPDPGSPKLTPKKGKTYEISCLLKCLINPGLDLIGSVFSNGLDPDPKNTWIRIRFQCTRTAV
jgi:hypothetical protein